MLLAEIFLVLAHYMQPPKIFLLSDKNLSSLLPTLFFHKNTYLLCCFFFKLSLAVASCGGLYFKARIDLAN